MPRLLFAFALAMTIAGCRETSTTASSSPTVKVQESGVDLARVTWPAAARVDRTVLSRLPSNAAARVPHSTVPVLIPANAELLANATIITEPVFYAFAASVEGMNVSIQGTRGEYRAGEVVPFERRDIVRGKGAIISETDAIWTATWTENGVAYAVSVECTRAEDPRCNGKGFIRELAETLAYVGGAAEETR